MRKSGIKQKQCYMPFLQSTGSFRANDHSTALLSGFVKVP